MHLKLGNLNDIVHSTYHMSSNNVKILQYFVVSSWKTTSRTTPRSFPLGMGQMARQVFSGVDLLDGMDYFRTVRSLKSVLWLDIGYPSNLVVFALLHRRYSDFISCCIVVVFSFDLL